MVAALAHRPVTVILEPDAIPHAVTGCVSPAQVGERYQLLAEAVGALKASGPVEVYLDAGGPGFVSDLERIGGGPAPAAASRQRTVSHSTSRTSTRPPRTSTTAGGCPASSAVAIS